MASHYHNLLAAMAAGDIGEALRAIATGIDLNYACDEGATPLYAAILTGDCDLVRAMLDRGADPNFIASEPAASIYAEKPLDLAMQARFLMDWDKYQPIVTLLMEYGATDCDDNFETLQEAAEREQRAREFQHGRLR